MKSAKTTKATPLLRIVPILAALVVLLLFATPAWAATFTVNSERDAPDADPGDGVCATATDDCTLRAAIQEANANGEPDTINLAEGNYQLTLAGTAENDAQTGDLDITSNITIEGAGEDSTTVDGNNIDRVFDVRPGGEADISGVTITGGRIDDTGGDLQRGGGIRNEGTLTLDNVTVTENQATEVTGTTRDGDGGGIYNSGTLTVNQSTISDNFAADDGGGINNDDGTVNLFDSTVSGNEAGDQGGGIRSTGGDSVFRIFNSTLGNNTAGGQGGGLLNNSGDVGLLNVTFNENSASEQGSNIGNIDGGDILIENTIVANGQNGENCFGPLTAFGDNLDTGTSCGFSVENGDPNLGPLADNGGPTQTFALQAGSEAIDNGDDDLCPETDQRGEPRPADGDGDGNARCDIGAFEAQPTDLAVEKQAPETVQAGEEFTYTLTVTNNGPNTATGVTLTDQLPDGVRPSDPQNLPEGCTYDAQSNTITCDIGTLDAGASAERQFQVTANTAGEKINEATVEGDNLDDDQQNNTATATTTVTAAADLAIDKQAPEQVDDGAQFTYTLTVTNNGPTAAEGVTITDQLPDGVSFDSAGGGCTYDEASRTVTCDVGALAEGESATRGIQVTAETSGEKENTATVSSNTDDPNGQNNSDSEITEVMPEADVSVQKADSQDPVLVGEQFTYTVTATNNGPSRALNTQIIDRLPDGVTPSGPLPDGCTYDAASNTITCDVGRLANGESAERQFQVTASSEGEKTNEVEVTSDTPDPQAGNDTTTEGTTVQPAADLAVDKQAPDDANRGEPFTYTVTVTNNGPSPATGVRLVDELPADVTPVDPQALPGGCTYDAQGNTITCDVGALGVGESAERQFQVEASSVGEKTNTARANSPETADPNGGNNSDSATTDVETEADLSVAKTDSQDPVVVGQEFTYTVTVANDGPNRARGVQISDGLPANVEFVGQGTDDRCTYNEAERTVTCERAEPLPAGQEADFDIQVRATEDGQAENAVTVSSNTQDPDGANNDATETTTIQPAADLRIQKDAPQQASAGGTLDYTLTVTNDSPDDATGVTVRDALPRGTEFVAAGSDPRCSTSDGGSNTVVCDLGALVGGASDEFQIQVRATSAGEKENVARVSGDQADNDTSNNRARATTQVIPSADLRVEKTDSQDPVLAGEPFTYTVTATNDGPSRAAGVTLTDRLPDGVTPTDPQNLPDGCEYDAQPNTITCDAGRLPDAADNDTVTYDFKVASDSAGQKTNEAEVTSSTGDPNPDNNTATETTTVQPASNLALDKQAPEQVADESLFTYTLTVDNDGPSPAAGVQVTDELPDGVEFVRDGTDDRCTFNPDNDTVTCGRAEPLPSGEQGTFEIRARAKAAGERVENTATVQAQPADPNDGNNRDSATTRIQARADLAIDKRAPGRVTDEDKFTYTLNVKNNGPSSTGNVRVTDDLPDGVKFLSASRGCKVRNSTVRCRPFELASGATKQVKITVRAKEPGRKVNRASVSGSANDPRARNNRDSAATRVVPAPRRADLSVKANAPNKVRMGNRFPYTVTVTNRGPDTARNVISMSKLPRSVKFVRAPKGCSYNRGNRTVTCKLGDIRDDAKKQRRIVVKAAKPGKVTLNGCYVKSNTNDPNRSNNDTSG